MSEPIDTTGLSPAFVPRLKLFLSLDIVGSTAFKQPLDLRASDAAMRSIRWATTIQGFYREAAQAFFAEWDKIVELGKVAGYAPGSPPRFWKTVGDEVIFWKELGDDIEIWLTIACWIKAIARVRASFRDDSDSDKSGLDLKSTLWIAGFPLRNRALIASQTRDRPIKRLAAFYNFKGNTRPPVDVDFIGPGIDVGFRLASLSSPKKMTISIDCAYLMMLTRDRIVALEHKIKNDLLLGSVDSFMPTGTGRPVTAKPPATHKTADREDEQTSEFLRKFAIFFSGNQVLKGVLGGIHYPHLWINVTPADTLVAARDALYGDDRRPIGWSKLEHFCDKFYADRSRYIAKPFINNAASASIRNLTDEYRDQHRKFQDEFAKEFDLYRES